MPLASFSDFASLTAATRAQRQAERAALPTFRANAGGPFLKPRTFDPGCPSTRATDAAAESVARSARDAAAVRASYARFDTAITSDPHAFNGGRFSTSKR